MIYIFLDTNIFFNNWHFKSGDFKFLFNYIENTDSVLLISELVCEEAENIRNRELESIVTVLKQEVKKCAKYNSTLIEFEFDKLNEEKYSFKSLLNEKASDIIYFAYDSIKQSDVVKRALKRIKPFQEGEKGYRDTLIWLSFLSYLSINNIESEVAFITANKEDFFNSKGDDFHPDLKADIEHLNLKCEIKTYNSLFSFIKSNVNKDEHDITQSKLLEDHLYTIEYELENEAIDFINNISEIRFKEILEKNRLRNFLYVNSLIYHSIELIEGVEDSEILSYKKLTKNTVYISFRYNLRICALNLTIPTSDYNLNRQQIDKEYWEIQTNENLTSFIAYVRTYLDVSFEYDMEKKTMEGYYIETIDFK